MHRRSFIRQAGVAAALLGIGGFPFSALAGGDERKLTILHTADMHIGLQAANWRSAQMAINDILNDHTLLLDAGDMFHGDGLLNKAQMCSVISSMRYDAVTLGEHDFDMGMDALAERISHASFPVLAANYDVTGTPLETLVKPYTIIYKNGIKVGILGIGALLEPNGPYGKIKQLDPLVTALEISYKLKHGECCDMVVCTSHLGYEQPYGKISDGILAAETECIDVITGGHTHLQMLKPALVLNKKNKEVFVCQTGWGGGKIGQLNFCFIGKKNYQLINAQSVSLAKQTSAV